jgi:hypothetical protein
MPRGRELLSPKNFSKSFAKRVDKSPQVCYNINTKRGGEHNA